MANDLTGGFILVCFVIFAVFWFATAFQTKRTIESVGRPIWVRLFLIAIFLIVVVPRFGVARFVSSKMLWRQTLAIGVFADVVTFLGLVISLWARVVLGGNWSSNVVFKEQHELIERGPYAYVRHPIYTGTLLMLLGFVIWRGTLTGFILFAIVVTGVRLKARQEEDLLTKHFKKSYTAYKARVKALIPKIW
jgi:protein-S-isoprenylcysteine O-methyltransferase Ste14